MGANLLWWLCILLETILLMRGILSNLAKQYRLFYTYLACILFTEIIRLSCYEFAPDSYGSLYWYTELATIVTSYAVIVEILHASLQSYPAMSRRVRHVLWVVFVLTLSYACCDLLANGFVSVARVAADLGRDLRYVEGGLLLLTLWFLGRHRISLGRNLAGITIGSAVWIGANVINLALLSFRGQEFSALLRGILPVTYLAALTIWCLTLWSPAPKPVSQLAIECDEDLAIVSMKTRAAIAGTSESFLKVMK
jgi:hypothetical protein